MQADTAMPTQSAPQVSPTQPISYGAPAAQTAAQAPSVATSPQWVAPYQQAVAPYPQAPAQMAVAPTQYSPTPYAPQPTQPQAENPYREAFNKVVGLLSSPVQFPFLGQQSNGNQVIDPASYSSPATTQYSNSVAPTSLPGNVNPQGYSNNYSQTSQEISPEQLLANGVSEQSLAVIDHFGPDAANILNTYSCQLEDSLIQTNQQLIEAVNLLQEMSNEHKAYETILVDPDVLADYTCQFFGENGPYPIPDEEPVAQMQQPVGQQYMRPQIPQAAQVQPERPQMPVPPQPQQQGNPVDFWNSFGSVADRDPANAWRYLNMASPEAFRQKLLVME